MARYLPGIAALAVILVGGVWRVVNHRRRYSSSGIAVFRSAGWSERIPEIAIVGLTILLVGEIVAWTFWPDRVAFMVFAPHQDFPGILVIAIGLGIVVRAQSDLGASWRVGIDRSARPGLVVIGLYRASRNPIYLGMFVVLLGFLLLMPTALSVFILAGAVLAVRQQVLSEESYLLEAYGQSFREYAQRVGRFLPWLGRL